MMILVSSRQKQQQFTFVIAEPLFAHDGGIMKSIKLQLHIIYNKISIILKKDNRY